MELKSNISTTFPSSVLRSNRTFMELKFENKAVDSRRFVGSNRTFMELKSLLLVDNRLCRLF